MQLRFTHRAACNLSLACMQAHAVGASLVAVAQQGSGVPFTAGAKACGNRLSLQFRPNRMYAGKAQACACKCFLRHLGGSRQHQAARVYEPGCHSCNTATTSLNATRLFLLMDLAGHAATFCIHLVQELHMDACCTIDMAASPCPVSQVCRGPHVWAAIAETCNFD